MASSRATGVHCVGALVAGSSSRRSTRLVTVSVQVVVRESDQLPGFRPGVKPRSMNTHARSSTGPS